MSLDDTVSAIIPTLGIDPHLTPLVTGLHQEKIVKEIIIVDGNGQCKDMLPELASYSKITILTAPRGRGRQLATGSHKASCPWLFFLHADSTLPANWQQAIIKHITHYPEKAGYFWLRFDVDRPIARLFARWANLRSYLFALPYGDQGLLISRELYDLVGGISPLPLMEDVVIARSLGRACLHPVGCYLTTSAERYIADGWLRRGLRNSYCMLLYKLGVSVEKIAKIYAK